MNPQKIGTRKYRGVFSNVGNYLWLSESFLSRWRLVCNMMISERWSQRGHPYVSQYLCFPVKVRVRVRHWDT